MNVLRESLPDDAHDDDEAAWEAELNRRSEEIESGKAVGRPTSEMFAELRKRYS
jgi:putative addiction module component (TIGR02574 family)